MDDRTGPPSDDQILDAIESVEAEQRRRSEEAHPAEIMLYRQAHVWAREAIVSIDASPGPTASLMLRNPETNAWRAIVLPDGSRWQLAFIGRPDGLIVPN
jgi:hypothetical protein